MISLVVLFKGQHFCDAESNYSFEYANRLTEKEAAEMKQDSIRLMKETQRRTRRPFCSLPGRLTSLQEKGAAAGLA